MEVGEAKMDETEARWIVRIQAHLGHLCEEVT